MFEFQSKTPVSILINILKCKKIKSKLEEIYDINNVDIRLIYIFLFINRKAIATYIRSIYVLNLLSYKNANQHIAIDKSLFTHISGNQVWVVGLINIDTNKIRLKVAENRNTNTMKEILTKHVGIGNIINTESWSAYTYFTDLLDTIFAKWLFHYFI